ncbi:MAG: Kae1-associated kinase Bud32 [Desulfurococcaceae archaeon]
MARENIGQNKSYLLLTRGAEAEIYLIDFFNLKSVLKRRLRKPYRDPAYDQFFIQHRTKIETKVLIDLYKQGLNVPYPLLVDLDNGIIIMKYIEGFRLSDKLGELPPDKIHNIAIDLGSQIAKMHNMGIYHGDLTLANVIYGSDERTYLIDFGLAGYSNDVEEYAIDLHLMHRSLKALYPRLYNIFMESFLSSYKKYYKGDFEKVEKKFLEIRTRGRYVDRKLRKTLMGERYVEN